MCILLLLAFLMLPSPTLAEESPYQQTQTFSLSLNGLALRFPKPLQPLTTYTIRISSPFNLKPLTRLRLLAKLRPQRQPWNQSAARIGWVLVSSLDPNNSSEERERVEETRHGAGLLFNGEPHLPVAFDPDAEYVGALTFQVRGLARYLSIRTVADFRLALETDSVTTEIINPNQKPPPIAVATRPPEPQPVPPPAPEQAVLAAFAWGRAYARPVGALVSLIGSFFVLLLLFRTLQHRREAREAAEWQEIKKRRHPHETESTSPERPQSQRRKRAQPAQEGLVLRTHPSLRS